MSWQRVAVIYAVLAVLTGYVFLVDRHPAPEEPGTPEPPAESLLGIDAGEIDAMTLRKGARVLRAARQDHRWRVIEPAGAAVTPDLLEATIATLTAGQGAEKLATEAEHDLAAYGLDAPSASIEIVIARAPDHPITVLIGARNPTQTAVYARRSDQSTIFLVGMNVSYYIDLIFDAAKS